MKKCSLFSGEYSDGEELYTSGLGGCIVTLLSFERQGIMTHYPSFFLEENIQRLKVLRDTHLNGNDLRGIILVKRLPMKPWIFETDLQELFPGITLDTLVYDPALVGMVSLYPSQAAWQTEQHGRRTF